MKKRGSEFATDNQTLLTLESHQFRFQLLLIGNEFADIYCEDSTFQSPTMIGELRCIWRQPKATRMWFNFCWKKVKSIQRRGIGKIKVFPSARRKLFWNFSWGHTPYDDAKAYGHKEICEILEKWQRRQESDSGCEMNMVDGHYNLAVNIHSLHPSSRTPSNVRHK